MFSGSAGGVDYRCRILFTYRRYCEMVNDPLTDHSIAAYNIRVRIGSRNRRNIREPTVLDIYLKGYWTTNYNGDAGVGDDATS